MVIVPGDLDDPRVRALLELHQAAARAATAPGSDHGLDVEGLKAPGTGSWAYFQPARALYWSAGFIECPPFGEYVHHFNSVFMSLELR